MNQSSSLDIQSIFIIKGAIFLATQFNAYSKRQGAPLSG